MQGGTCERSITERMTECIFNVMLYTVIPITNMCAQFLGSSDLNEENLKVKDW